MLSDRKSKQKIGVDPQNKKWIDDKNSFGFKMLQKMGWEEGKGLGLNNDGTVESISVIPKSNNSGIGVSKNETESYHQLSTFDSLLKELNKREKKEGKKNKEKRDKEKVIKSTENKRLSHRNKFIKNKRVEQYSEQHLSEILGIPLSNKK